MEETMKNQVLKSVFYFTVLLLITACGSNKSQFIYTEKYAPLQSIKNETCSDAAVLLNKSLKETKDIALKTLSFYDGAILEQKEYVITAKRKIRSGFIAQSGGETITIEMSNIDATRTFVTIATEKGFVGYGAMSFWSCDMIDHMVKLASK
jgi:hypothetical protein